MKTIFTAIFFFYLLISGNQAIAQTTCNCPENFDYLTEKIRINYAGYQDKVNTNTKAAFEKLTAEQRTKAAQAKTDDECFKVLRGWTDFFKDRHTGVSFQTPSAITETDPVKIRAMFAGSEKIKLSEKEARKYLDKKRKKLDPIEGIYRPKDGNYRVAIIRNETKTRNFAAVILKADSIWWMPGQIKMEFKKAPEGYQTAFYMRDHSRQEHLSKLTENELKIGALSSYVKVYPESKETGTEPAVQPGGFSLVSLSPNTMLLTLPHFDHRMKPVIDSLIKTNRQKLLNTPNLIIDVRNNGGGSDISYMEILPYLYTNPMKAVSSAIWSSDDNIAKFQAVVDDKAYPESSKKETRALIEKMKAAKGTFIDRPDYTYTRDSVYANPKRVAVLIDKGCASSGEQFVLAAKESKKVTTYGNNTAGVLDYANVQNLKMPCPTFGIYYATSRSKRLPHYPIDNIGIAPDVRLPEDLKDPVKHVQQLMENGK